MNKFLRVLLYIFSSITMVLALAFIVLEGRLVIAGDWVIYDNAADGFIRYFFRLLLAIIVFAKCILEFVFIKKNINYKQYLFYVDVGMVCMSIIVLIWSTNYVGVALLALSIIPILIKILLIKFKKTNEKIENN